MSKLLNVALLGMTLAFVSCGHFGGKKCCGDEKQCKTDMSCCKDGKCEMTKKKKKS